MLGILRDKRTYALFLVLGGMACFAGGCGASEPESSPPEVRCSSLEQLPRRIWRLSVQQVSNSVRDLLGLPAAPSLFTTGGTSEYAFFSGDGATVDPQLLFQLNIVVRQAMSEVAPRISQISGCETTHESQDCADRFVRSFGRRAFRRTLEESEVIDLLAVHAEGAKKDFNTGISLMIQALLQSPSFLFRSELGGGDSGNTTLTSYEIATQLSYTFLDSTPDSELLDKAARGELDTPEGVAREIDRLLTTDAAKANITRIVLDWFNTRQLYAKTKSADLLTALGGAAQDQAILRDDFYESARRFVDHVLWNSNGRLTDLVTSERLFVNQRMATLFGVPFGGAPGEFVSADIPAGQRAGMLTQPAVLWSASDPVATSIVKRGKLVHDDVICGDPLPPPTGILEDPAVQATLATLPTEIDKSNYRLATGQCAGCHQNIDPYGLILENFDSIGRFRTMADGLPVRPTGDFAHAPPLAGAITGPSAFASAIVANGQFAQCATQKLASFAIGRMIRQNTTCEVLTVRSDFDRSDGTISALFRRVMMAEFVKQRTGSAR